MLVWIWTRNDAGQVTSSDFFDGDIFRIEDDSYASSVGEQEKKSWLIVKMDDHADQDELVAPEYETGPSPEENVTRRQRKYRIDWRPRFTPDERAIIEDDTQLFGTGIVEAKVGLRDIVRK